MTEHQREYPTRGDIDAELAPLYAACRCLLSTTIDYSTSAT